MQRTFTHHRLVAAILVVLVLGMQFVNVLSNSHTRVVHRHGQGKAMAGQADVGHAQGLGAAKGKGAHAHAHQHDPGDHSHDLPLRRVMAVIQFSFLPVWHTETVAPIRSALVRPLERPPKPAGDASIA
jgi:hypothetical protein